MKKWNIKEFHFNRYFQLFKLFAYSADDQDINWPYKWADGQDINWPYKWADDQDITWPYKWIQYCVFSQVHVSIWDKYINISSWQLARR